MKRKVQNIDNFAKFDGPMSSTNMQMHAKNDSSKFNYYGAMAKIVKVKKLYLEITDQ